MNKKVPVLFLTFNRLDETIKSFEKIIEYKPQKLYLASDGARINHVKEQKTVDEIRNYLISKINWPCEVFTRFNDFNEGCKVSVSNSITWFFKYEEYGVIIEDDCLVDLTFFDFCLLALEYYKDNPAIWHIDGSNFTSNLTESDSMHFSKYFLIWGWATWRRAWNQYSINMNGFPDFLSENKINNIFQINDERKYWLHQLNLAYFNRINTWDYQWFFTIWNNDGLSVRPNVNLVRNIGFSSNATHTKKDKFSFADVKVGKIKLPMKFDNKISQNIEIDQKCSVVRFNILPFYKKLLKKIF